MVSQDFLNQLLRDRSVFLVVKGGVLILLFIYFLFSLIIVRQVKIMMKVLVVPVSPIFRVIILLHVVLSFLVLLFAFVII